MLLKRIENGSRRIIHKNSGMFTFVMTVPAADTADKKLQIPTIGPMSKGDYDALLKTAADNGSAPTLYTVTMQAMSTAAASALQQKADALGVHYTSKWVED